MRKFAKIQKKWFFQNTKKCVKSHTRTCSGNTIHYKMNREMMQTQYACIWKEKHAFHVGFLFFWPCFSCFSCFSYTHDRLNRGKNDKKTNIYIFQGKRIFFFNTSRKCYVYVIYLVYVHPDGFPCIFKHLERDWKFQLFLLF